MAGESVYWSDFVPSEPFQPSPAHVSRREVELGQALVHQNLHFQSTRWVSQSLCQRLPCDGSVQHGEFFVLQPRHLPHKRTEDIARQISYGCGFTRWVSARNQL